MRIYQPDHVPTRGGFTLPTEAGQDELVLELARKWGADTIRDSDGTELSESLTTLGFDIFSTVCITRADQEYVRSHQQFLIQKFLRSDPETATATTLILHPMAGFYDRKYRIDPNHDPNRWWEVHDRTSGRLVPADQWSFDPATGLVHVRGCTPYHQYTVNFLVQQIWDSTSMHNHLTNHWTCDPIMSVNPYHPECYTHLMGWFDRWLADHPKTTVVRLTTLCYHFAIDAGADGRTRYFDGQGYADTVSIPALEDFERDYGYRLTAEDFVDQGYYHNWHRVPTRRQRDWMEHIHRFVVRLGRDLTDRIHRAGKRAAIFWGDHWIGVEPYLPSFQDMGIDIHINACEGGVVTRRCSEAPGPQTKELRFYPYLFPDTFYDGGFPLRDSKLFWANVRRALIHAPVARIGYGGYLTLAAKFPDFVAHVATIASEFRAISTVSGRTKPHRHPVKVGILTAWGSQRAWIPHEGRDQKFAVPYGDNMFLLARSYMLECLAGLPFEVAFLSFDEILATGIPTDLDVLINDGDIDTSFSGGSHWVDPEIASAVRGFVHQGGGFIGVREPTAHAAHGRVFQLCDVLGVDLELGQSPAQRPVAEWHADANHFILADPAIVPDFGTDRSYVMPVVPDTQVLATGPGGHVLASARRCGSGRAVYFAGLPATVDNFGLLLRTILWAGGREDCLLRWHSENHRTECAWFPATGKLVVVNNTDSPQTTRVFDGTGMPSTVTLPPYGCEFLTA